jgi:O-methyltransferase/8-demethyl-8-(2,3-dimethoxy-alpha-L-rhamnosyl)tetracenomycin-C 4'-O-methyltransferase
MARAIQDAGIWPRRVHLFDSFKGLPEPGENDGDLRAAHTPAGIACQSLREVKEHFVEWGIPQEMLVYHPGWFADTLPNHGISQIALLRIDCDLYESAALVMKHLYPLVAPGGWVIADDWNLDGFRQALLEYPGFGDMAPVYWRRPA